MIRIGTVALGVTSRSLVGSSTATEGSASASARASNRVVSPGWLRKPSRSTRSNQKGPDSSRVKAVTTRLPSADVGTVAATPAPSPRRSEAEASGLLAAATTSTRVPRTPLSWVRPGARVVGGRAVYAGGTSLIDTSASEGGGTTSTVRGAVRSSPASTAKANDVSTASIRPWKRPRSSTRRGSTTSGLPTGVYVTRAAEGTRSPGATATSSRNSSPRATLPGARTIRRWVKRGHWVAPSGRNSRSRAIRVEAGSAAHSRTPTRPAAEAPSSARRAGRGSTTARKSMVLISSRVCATVASRIACEPSWSSRSPVWPSRRNWTVLARRSLSPGHRRSTFRAISRSWNRTTRGRATYRTSR